MDEKDNNAELEVGAERREFVRFPVNINLKFRNCNTGQEKEAQMYDIGAKGIGIWTDKEIPKDTILEIWIEIPNDGQVKYNQGSVAWSKEAGPSRYRSGIRFERIDFKGVSLILRATYGENWL